MGMWRKPLTPKRDDTQEETHKRDTEILGYANDRPSKHNTTRK